MALLETATLICGVGANPPSSKTLGRRIEAGARMRARVVRTAAIGVNVVQMVTAVALRALGETVAEAYTLRALH